MPEPRVVTFREALREAMVEEMERDPSIFLMGEEVGHYQGAYKVSEGMLARFGEKRVIDTPIAETGFAGVGIGAAMIGLRPIIEFMTWNFSLTAYDQLVNNAAKLRYMSNGQFTLPIVFRGPGGAAHALAAQHSQALEGFYAHVPGLKVVMPSTPADAKGLLKAAIRDDNPVCFIESEVMYALKGEVPAGEHVVPLGVAEVKRPGRDVTLVTWSKMTHTCLRLPRSWRATASRPRCSICAPSARSTWRRSSRRCGGRIAASSSRRGGRSPAWQPRWWRSSRAMPSTTSMLRPSA